MPYGLITVERLGVFAPVEFSRASNLTFNDLASYLRPNNQYQKFSRGGQLQPLPISFPTAFMDVSVLLCRGLDHEQLALLQHPNLSSAVLGQITQDALDPRTGDGGALRELPPILAAHPHIATNDLQRLFDLPYSYERSSPVIWRAAAMNLSAPDSYRQIYLDRIKGGEWRTRVWVARDKKAPREAWEVAIAPKESEVLQEFVRNPNAPSDMLRQIASNPRSDKVALAGNAATPADLLTEFAENSNPDVLKALLRNKVCPPAAVNRALETLGSNRSAVVRQSICKDPRLNQTLFLALMHDPNIQVRVLLAMNTNAPFEILTTLANDAYRPVSSRARDNLSARFPNQLTNLKPQWKPLNSLLPYSDLNAEFAEVVKQGNEPRLRELLAITEDENTRVSVRTVVDRILEHGFNRFSELLSEFIQTEGNSARNALFGSRYLQPEVLIWADRHELFDPNSAGLIIQASLQPGRSNLLSTLMESNAGKQMSAQNKAEALFKATEVRSLELMEIMLAHGAEPDRIVKTVLVPLYQTNRSPEKRLALGAVDFAAQTYFIAGVKRLDQKGKYRGMIVEFEKEFPSTQDSPYLGQWDNGRDGFGTSRFSLGPDATGLFGAGIFGGPAVWKATASGIELFLALGNGINRDLKIVMTTNASKNELVWKKEQGESEVYRKESRRP